MKELICIVCPKGCHLKIDQKLNVSGNSCPRGVKYAIDELTNPTRMVTTTILIRNGVISRLPVMTSKPIPKNKIMDVMKVLNEVKVTAPIYVGDVVLNDILGLGVDILATREVLNK